MKTFPDGEFNGFGDNNGIYENPMRLLAFHKEFRDITDEFFEEDEEDYFERDID